VARPAQPGDERAADAVVAMVGMPRDPGDLGGVVEVALEGQEADHGVVEHGGKGGLAADGLGALPRPSFWPK
jgi:hypothetical protein